MESNGIGSWLTRPKSGFCGSRGFFLGGENGETFMDGMLDTSSTNHGLTRLTFWSKSGSSHATYERQNFFQ